MSGAEGHLLLFLRDGIAPPQGWLRLRDGVVRARGSAGVPPPPIDTDVMQVDERVVLVVPGEDVVIHWIELPALSRPQAIAAARLMASEVSATPLDRLHVALGGADGAARAMALVSAERMAAWLAQAQALGFDADSILPEPLLMLPPESGTICWLRDGRHLLRGDTVALAADPALAGLLTEDPPLAIEDAAVEAGLGTVLASPVLDLRQGAFARRRRWRIDWVLLRRLVMLGGLMLLAVLAVQLVLILKYSLAADRLQRDLTSVARGALPRAGTIDEPAEQLSARLAELRGQGEGFSATAAIVFAAVRDTANVELAAFSFDEQGILRVTATAANPADLTALARRIEAGGLAVEAGDARPGGGRQIAELSVRSR